MTCLNKLLLRKDGRKVFCKIEGLATTPRNAEGSLTGARDGRPPNCDQKLCVSICSIACVQYVLRLFVFPLVVYIHFIFVNILAKKGE